MSVYHQQPTLSTREYMTRSNRSTRSAVPVNSKKQPLLKVAAKMTPALVSYNSYCLLLKMQRKTHHELLRKLAEHAKVMGALEKELLALEKSRSVLTFTRPKPVNMDTQLTKLEIQINSVKDQLKKATRAHEETETKAKEQRKSVDSTEGMMKKHYAEKWAATKGVIRD